MNKLMAAFFAPILFALACPAHAEIVEATFSGDVTGSFVYDSEAEPFSTQYEYNEDNDEFEAFASFGRNYHLTYNANLEGHPVSLEDRMFSFSMYHFLDRDTGLFMLRGYELNMILYVAAKFPTYGLPKSTDVTEARGFASIGPYEDSFEFNVNFAPFDSPQVSSVPEPATWAMMLVGFGIVGGAMRRRKSKFTSWVARPRSCG